MTELVFLKILSLPTAQNVHLVENSRQISEQTFAGMVMPHSSWNGQQEEAVMSANR